MGHLETCNDHVTAKSLHKEYRLIQFCGKAFSTHILEVGRVAGYEYGFVRVFNGSLGHRFW